MLEPILLRKEADECIVIVRGGLIQPMIRTASSILPMSQFLCLLLTEPMSSIEEQLIGMPKKETDGDSSGR